VVDSLRMMRSLMNVSGFGGCFVSLFAYKKHLLFLLKEKVTKSSSEFDAQHAL